MITCTPTQSFLDTGVAHYKDFEEQVFHKLKGEENAGDLVTMLCILSSCTWQLYSSFT